MSPKRSYRSFLIRYWMTSAGTPAGAPDERFVVESVTDAPQHWAFTSFEDLVDFLRAELLGPADAAAPEQQNQSDE